MRCSLWLLPEDPAPWAALIAELARRFGGPVFPPHLTLLGSAGSDEAVARARTATLARRIPALSLEPLAIGHGASRHQCLFALVRPDPALLAVRRAALAAFAHDEDGFLPHVSLLYGSLADDRRGALDGELSARPLPALRVAALALWSTDGDEASWRELARAALR